MRDALRRFDSAARPRPLLAAVVFVAAFALWPLAELTPADVVGAVQADAAFLAALGDGDATAIAETGRARMRLPVAPLDATALGLVAEALHRAGATADAIAIAESALDETRRYEGERSLAAALAANNLAWFLVSGEDPTAAELDAAHDLARDAVAVAPENPYLLGTLGTVELLRGELASARAHLQKAIAGHDPDRASATDRAILAVVLAVEGDPVGARASLDAARAAGTPDPAWAERAERALGSVH